VLARLLAGEMSAVGEVYDRNHEAIRRFARRLLGDASEAEDLVQEVFVRLPTIVKNYRGEASFRQFLIGVTARLGRHHVRSACRRREIHERNETERSLVRGTSPPPDAESERRELANILTRALDTLSFDHRVVFVLSEVEHQNSREIALVVGAPEGTVRTRLLHAKRNLRAYLAKEP
jgi:RNA polymerase sigma-70 factor, ECF subfamily